MLHIVHVALGGCLKKPPVSFGITADTGGHIAYVLGAALAQADTPRRPRVTIVTRAFDDPALGHEYGLDHEEVAERVEIVRLRTGDPRYLTKEALVAELPMLREAFLQWIDGLETPPDVVHAHFADAAVLTLAARERYGMAALYTPHSLALDKLACAMGRDASARSRIERERRAIVESNAIIVSSQDENRHQICAYDAKASRRVRVVPPGQMQPGRRSAAGDGCGRAMRRVRLLSAAVTLTPTTGSG